MEKLIPLLNEFINKTIYPYDRGAKCIWYENHLFLFETWTDVLEDTIISKRYLFIKWLVDKDKIDESKIFCDQWLYYSLLCKLAISDTPIEDLINYLN